MELNDIVFGNPPLEDVLTLKEGGSAAFNRAKSAGLIDRFIKSYPPPANDSPETRKELEYLAKLTQSLTPEEKRLCQQLDPESGIYEFFSTELAGMGVQITPEAIDRITERYWGIVTFIKHRINRPRPNQLAHYHRIPLYPAIYSVSADTAAYPSGHTFEFLLITDFIRKRKPELTEKLDDLYRRIRRVREMSGLHYPSDTVGAERLFRMLKSEGIIK